MHQAPSFLKFFFFKALPKSLHELYQPGFTEEGLRKLSTVTQLKNNATEILNYILSASGPAQCQTHCRLLLKIWSINGRMASNTSSLLLYLLPSVIMINMRLRCSHWEPDRVSLTGSLVKQAFTVNEL